MRIDELQLDEVKVMSSWIADLEYDRGVTFMTLLSGRRYRILGIPEGVFRQWVNAPSKGKFWHSHIRGNYRTTRI